MSIQGILAVLLGSTALGGYAPLTLLRAHRHYLAGLNLGKIGPMNSALSIYSGIQHDNFNISYALHHTLLGETDFNVFWSMQHIVLGFRGILASVLDFHTMIQETELDGYGYLYGESYGE